MRLVLLQFFFAYSIICVAQTDSVRKTSLLCMANFGALYPEHSYTENKSDNLGYSTFNVTPKLGYNTNIAIGISYKLIKECSIESLLGIGSSSSNYTKTGYSFSKYGIIGPDSFRGVINEKSIEQNLILLNGITFSNSNKSKNKLYFSNYISISMIFNKLLETETIDNIKNKKGTDEIHTKHLEPIINTSHIISYGFRCKKNVFKIGTGINFYFFNYNRGYINPFINLTLKI